MSKLTSDYHPDYSYDKSVYSQYTAYTLTATGDSVKSGLLLTTNMGIAGTTESKIKEKAEYFKNQLETADSLTEKIEGVIATNMPGDGQALALAATIEAIHSFTSEPSILGFFEAVLAILEGTPVLSLPIAVIEILALGPVIWVNLYNCRESIDGIQELI